MYTLDWGIAPLIGSPLSGVLFDSLGPPRLFLVAAGVVAVAILLLFSTYALWRKAEPTIEIII